MNGPWELSLQAALLLPSSAVDCTVLLSRLGGDAGSGVQGGDGGLSGSRCPWRGDSPEQLPSFLSAQLAPRDLGLNARMELGAATETFVLELRCLEDGGPGPGTLSGKGLERGVALT